MFKKLFMILAFCGIGGTAFGQFLIPLYAPGNTGGESTNMSYSLLSVTGQNTIGLTSNSNNKVYLGLLAPVRFIFTDAEITQFGGTQLFQNYPNPFKTKTTIPFEISKVSKVKLTIIDIVGQQVEVLLNQELPPGEHNVIFDAEKIKPGMFLYKLEVAGYAATKTMILTK